MKTRILLSATLLCALALSFHVVNISAQGKSTDHSKVVGTWKMQSEGRDGETRNYEWVISEKDGKLVATIPVRRRGGGGNGETPEVKEIDKAIYALLTDLQYNISTVLPDGVYPPKTFKIEPYSYKK